MASMSTSSSSTRCSSILDDPSNPLYLHHEESPDAMLVYQPLVGENYPTWARSMRMALIAKNKLGFIDGTLTLLSPVVKTSSAIQAWIRCDKMVTSWILNSVSQEIATSIVDKDTALEIWNDLRERVSQANGARVFQLQKDIAGITQGQSSITSYFTQLNVLWDQLQKFRPFPMCSCGFCTCNLGQKLNDLQYQDLVMQFLMGLNDSYAQVRAQILLMDPLPPINKVYSLLIQEERRSSVGNNSSPRVESSTPVTKVSSSLGNKNNKNSKGKEKLTCNHCGMNGHTVEMNSSSASTSFTFTQEQCQLFLAMLGTNSTSMAEFVANNLEFGNPTISEERIPSLVESSFSPSAKLESVSSVLNGTNPIPANNSDTDANGARSLSISLLFPPAMSEIETDDSCSESNETPRAAAQFSYSISSCFPPGRSETDSSSETDPSSTASPGRTATFKEILKPKSSNNSKSNRTPPKFSHSKKNDILSLFSTAMSLTNSSKRPRHTILTRRFKGVEIIVREKFPLKMLLEATNNFSKDCEIGKNGFGSLYHAILDDGREVTIHRAEISMSEQFVNEFLRGVEAWSRLEHKNVVRLLGFCEDGKDGLLVYEYLGYGTLHWHLHNPESTSLMSWAARIKVALDIARGIEYLHVYAVPQIIHRSIKPSNIFLDAMLTAKLSNFNLSMEAPVDDWSGYECERLVDTLRYTAPDYFIASLETKVDVYSFGVVLLEMLFGCKVYHANENDEKRLVVDFVAPYIAQKEIHKILDPKVPPPSPLEMEALANVASLALDCVSREHVLRPSMFKVANSIQSAWNGILEGQVIADNSIACNCESISDAESEF
ncbi:proline-rich receptor-like protein kinase PERK8 isoform X2 [Quercus robur]|uniref:proline-rich receptor-like protein kinase PERK8 isoform X2 n=1 Tax=Quercus robur TaxID=38942 RepID=UPI00216194FF|nr:proline-rich receptor-like protein kinase PERK8 isoform X2 [Quercus robur]